MIGDRIQGGAGIPPFVTASRQVLGPRANPAYPMGTGAFTPWNWPLTSVLCRDYKCVNLHCHSQNYALLTSHCHNLQIHSCMYNDVALFWRFVFVKWGKLLGIWSALYIRILVSVFSRSPSTCLCFFFSCGTCLYWNRFWAQQHKSDQRTTFKTLRDGLSKLIIIYLNKFLPY